MTAPDKYGVSGIKELSLVDWWMNQMAYHKRMHISIYLYACISIAWILIYMCGFSYQAHTFTYCSLLHYSPPTATQTFFLPEAFGSLHPQLIIPYPYCYACLILPYFSKLFLNLVFPFPSILNKCFFFLTFIPVILCSIHLAHRKC